MRDNEKVVRVESVPQRGNLRKNAQNPFKNLLLIAVSSLFV